MAELNIEVDDVGLDQHIKHIDYVDERNNYILIKASGTVLVKDLSIQFNYEYEASCDNGGGGHTLDDTDGNYNELSDEELDEVVQYLDENFDHNYYENC